MGEQPQRGRRRPAPARKRGERDLVQRGYGEPGQRDLQRVVMEQRDAGQHQCEQHEVDRERPDAGRFCRETAATATPGRTTTNATASRATHIRSMVGAAVGRR